MTDQGERGLPVGVRWGCHKAYGGATRRPMKELRDMDQERHLMVCTDGNGAQSYFECTVDGCGRELIFDHVAIRLMVLNPGDLSPHDRAKGERRVLVGQPASKLRVDGVPARQVDQAPIEHLVASGSDRPR